MNSLQKKECDILSEVVSICNDLGLIYYLVCGSALGAVKYDGFIPWDDDVDIALPREDYDTFIDKAQGMLSKHLFLQNYKTDPKFPNIYSKVRDSNTTFIEKSVKELPIHHGVYIDVFPLDGYPKQLKKTMLLEWKKRVFNLKLACIYPINGSVKTRLLFRLERMFGVHKRIEKIISKFEKEISAYDVGDSLFYCNHGNWQGKLEYAPKTQYGNGTWATFEGMKVRIPENYDEYLTQKYGDWRVDLPEDQKEGHHYTEIMDLDRPYTDYIEHLKNGKIRIKKRKE